MLPRPGGIQVTLLLFHEAPLLEVSVDIGLQGGEAGRVGAPAASASATVGLINPWALVVLARVYLLARTLAYQCTRPRRSTCV